MTKEVVVGATGQSVSVGSNLFERWMLKRISNLALRLPNEFDREGMAGMVRVSGKTVLHHTDIAIKEEIPAEGDGAVRFTDLAIHRLSTNPTMLTGLTADRYISDDVGEMTGATGPHERFTLGAEGNELSMWNIMRSVSLAVRTVEASAAQPQVFAPEYHYP